MSRSWLLVDWQIDQNTFFGLLSKWIDSKFRRSSCSWLHLDTTCFRLLPPLERSSLIIVLPTQPRMPNFKISKFWSKFVEVNRLKWVYECAEAICGFDLIFFFKKKKRSQGRVKFEEIVSAELRFWFWDFWVLSEKSCLGDDNGCFWVMNEI